MFGLAKVFGFGRRTSRRQARRRRSFRASLEAVEDRALMSTLSAVNWTSGGQEHTDVFAIDQNDAVEYDQDATGLFAKGWVPLGGPPTPFGAKALQISAGLDAAGNPKVYAIGADHQLYSNDFNGSVWSGWSSPGGYAKQVSATAYNKAYYIGIDDGVYVYNPSLSVELRSLHALQISAGLGVNNKPEVWAIGSDNGLYINDGSGWQARGGWVKQISATAYNAVYCIGQNDTVYLNTNTPYYVQLGFSALDISGGSDNLGRPEVWAIGSDNGLYVDDYHGFIWSGWQPKGNYVQEIAAPSLGNGLPGEEAYAITLDPTVDVYYSFIGGSSGWFQVPGGLYVQVPGDPGTMSAVNVGSGVHEYNAVFAIGYDHSVYADIENSPIGWVQMTGVQGVQGVQFKALQISAGTDAYGDPEVWAIGTNHSLYVNDLNGAGWFDVGGWVKQISATAHGTVFFIDSGNAVDWGVYNWMTHGWSGGGLGGYALQISAGMDAYGPYGRPEVYAIGTNHQVFVNVQLSIGNYSVNYSGWQGLGGYAKQISATEGNTVFAIGYDDAVWKINGTSGSWTNLGLLYTLDISAGLDANGQPEVWAIDNNNNLWVNDGPNGAYWLRLSTSYFREIAAPSLGYSLPGDEVYAIGSDHTGYIYSSSNGFVQVPGALYLQG
jgi:hypothetical protein